MLGLVNSLTCANEKGEVACQLFPEMNKERSFSLQYHRETNFIGEILSFSSINYIIEVYQKSSNITIITL